MHRTTLMLFAAVVLAVSALIWGAESAFPQSSASAVVLVAITVLGLWVVRPGWHLRPVRAGGYWLAPVGLLLASAAGAAWFLVHHGIALPYDMATLNIAAAIPAIIAITGIEELLFRQVLYRWLEQRAVSARGAVIATAVAFGWAHLGPVFVGSAIGAAFYLLQSAYMVWIGLLLGEIRRATGSWTLPWFGHFSYNLAVLYCLSIM
jgi:membrane protease YdiL (CAAX protease family)